MIIILKPSTNVKNFANHVKAYFFNCSFFRIQGVLIISLNFSEQCPAGIAQQLGNINTACSLERPIACQEGYACRKPLFGPGSICCPKQGLTFDTL